MPETGTLSEKPGAELFREMVDSHRGGILRVSAGQQIKVVVFEDGRPVFAVSNVPEDQLDVLLVRQRKLTPDQARALKTKITKESELPAAILSSGLLDGEAVLAARIDQVERVIQSVMRWTEGQYLLDTSARAPHDITIDAPVHQWLLDTARNVSPELAMLQLGGPEARYVHVQGATDGVQMSPLDGFLLSRVTESATIAEIQTESGLPDDQCLPVLYALFASNLIARAGSASAAGAAQSTARGAPDEASVDEIRAELDRVLARYRDAELYDVLDVTRRAEPSAIKASYYQLAKQFHPDKYHHASDPEIRSKLEAIFLHISRAYDTLKDPRLRADYDRRLGSGHTGPIASRTVAPPPPPPPPPPPKPSRGAAAGFEPPPAAPPRRPDPPAPPSDPPSVSAQSDEPTLHAIAEAVQPSISVEQTAETNYVEGQRRLASKDLVGAVHCFRQAVRLCPNNSSYQVALGTVLCNNARWYKEAETHLLEASRYDPLNSEIFLSLGKIYRSSGLTKRAESQYRAVLAFDPSNRAARQALIDMGCDVPAAKHAGGSGLLGRFFKKK